MPPSETSNRIGIGTDLLGGKEVLEMLQQIRAEMQAIASLSGRGQKGDIYGGNRQTPAEFEQDIRKREEIELASIKRIARARQESQRPITDREVNAFADQQQRRVELKRRVDQRIAEDDRRQAQDRERLQRQEEERKYRTTAEYAKKRKDVVNQIAGGPQVEIDPYQRSAFRNVRRDPAARNDPTTQQWRDEFAVQLRAAGIQRDRLSQENRALQQLQQQRASLRNNATAARGSFTTYDARTENIQGVTAFQEELGTRGSFAWKGQMLAQYKDEQYAQQQSALASIERRKTVNNLKGTERYTADFFKSPEGRAFLKGNTTSKGRKLILPGDPAGPDGPGGEGGGKTPNLNDPNLLNEKGFFTSAQAAGRIARNILLYELISRATYGLIAYAGEAVKAAKETDDLGRAMEFATQQASGNIQANRDLVESLKNVGLSRQQGLQAVTEAARFAEFGNQGPGATIALTQTAANIASVRGLGVGNTGQLIEQLLRRGERGIYKQVFGITPSEIYDNYARQQLQGQTTSPFTTPGLFTDRSKVQPNEQFKTLSERVKDYTSNMSDAEKEAAAFNYVLSQSSRFQDEASERANSLAGRVDKIGAAFENAKADVGSFLLDIKPVGDVLALVADRVGLLEKLRAPQIRRSGEANTITNADIAQYGTDSTSGGRYTLLSELNRYLGPVATGVLGTAGLGLIGRKTATLEYRTGIYNQQKSQLIESLDGNIQAAQTEAAKIAKEQRPGLLRSVGTGIRRLTVGMSDSILGLAGTSSRDLIQFAPGARTVYGTQNIGPVAGAQGPYSAYNAVTPLTEAQRGRLGTVQSGIAAAGGLIGGAIGGTLGYLTAQALHVGPITATGLTIAGGIGGNIIGTTVGQVAAQGFGGYVERAGGFGKLGATAVGAAPLALTAGTVILGLGLGAAVGTGLREIAPSVFTPLAYREQVGLDRDTKANEAYQLQQRESNRATLEGRRLYPVTNPQSARFGQLVSLEVAQKENNEDQVRAGVYGGGQYGQDLLSVTLSQAQLAQRPSRFTQVGTGRVDRFGQEITETKTERQLELEKQLTGEFQSQQQVQGELAKVQEQGVGLEGEAKTLNDDKIRSLEYQLGLFQQITEEQKKAQVSTDYGADAIAALTFGGQKGLDQYIQGEEQTRVNFLKSREEQKQKTLQDIAEIGQALDKLRSAGKDSYQVVGNIAAQIVGTDNPFTKVLADQLTLGERMQQQWGFLGQAATDYFTKLEQRGLNRQLNVLEYQSYGKSSNLLNQAAQEKDVRNGPGLSTQDQNYLNIQEAIVNRALEVPKLWSQAAQALGRTISPLALLRSQVRELQIGAGIGPSFVQSGVLGLNGQTQTLGANIRGFRAVDYTRLDLAQIRRAGLSQEVRQRSDELYAQGILGLGSPDEFRKAGLGNIYARAAGIQAGSFQRNINEAQQKAELQATEDARLNAQLRADDEFRQTQLRKGRDSGDVGQESDALLLARTANVSPKDLNYQAFADRQGALRRTAERETQNQQEAKAAVLKGLEYQQSMNRELEIIRTALLGGDIKMLMQVQNDTQARIDTENLEDLKTNGFPGTAILDKYQNSKKR